MHCCCLQPPEQSVEISAKNTLMSLIIELNLNMKRLIAFCVFICLGCPNFASLTITNDEISAVVGLVKLAVSSYLAPLETCLRLISRFEQSGRQIAIP